MRLGRRRLILALVALLLLCGVGYGYAFVQRNTAANQLSQVQAQTLRLQAEQRKFSDVTKIQGSITEVQQQISRLMSNDVDFGQLVANLRGDLPAGMTISQATVTLTVASPTGATSSAAKGNTSLDTSGHAHIGSITMSGTGVRLDDVSSYVDRLRTVKGIVEVVPTSNQAAQAGVQFSLMLTVTDELLTHRFDTAKKGGK
jgi:uncharacterized protein HemX